MTDQTPRLQYWLLLEQLKQQHFRQQRKRPFLRQVKRLDSSIYMAYEAKATPIQTAQKTTLFVTVEVLPSGFLSEMDSYLS